MSTNPSASGAGGGLKPYQFTPETYGAVGNGKIGTGGTGTAASAAFSDAGASFTAADQGKLIIINQGLGGTGTTQGPFVGTIQAVNSLTSVTLSGVLAANAASAPYIYGSDDAPAIQAAVNAAAAYAEANNNYAEVVFSTKFYMLGALVQATAPTQYNSHITIPVGPQFGQKLVLGLVGVITGGSAGIAQYFESTQPNLQGPCLVSAVMAAGQPNVTFGQQSIIGGPTGVSANMTPGQFANTHLVIDGITIIVPYNGQQFGVNAARLAGMNVPDAAVQVFAPVNLSGATPLGGPWLSNNNIVNNGISVGFNYPVAGNNAACDAGRITVEGMAVGVQFAEHFNGKDVTCVYCDHGLQPNVPGSSHGADIGKASVEICNWALFNASTGGPYPINIGLLDQEQINTGHISDASNFLTGQVNHYNSSATRPVVTGGANLRVIDVLHNGPGHMASPPAVPASGVAFTPVYRDATIVIHTGVGVTVSIIAVDGTATGQTLAASSTSAPVRVPSGKAFALTYAGGTPTCDWWLD